MCTSPFAFSPCADGVSYFKFIVLYMDRGAQVGVAALAVNYINEQGIGISESRASQLFSFCQMTFTFGRCVPFSPSHRVLSPPHFTRLHWPID